MKRYLKTLLVPILFVLGCADDEPFSPAEPVEQFFMELTLGGSTYRVSDQTHKMYKGSSTLLCQLTNGYVNGHHRINMDDPTEKSFIKTLGFNLSKKVFTDELDPQDELSYVRKVVTAPAFGFPIPGTGFYEAYDPENGIFEVSRNLKAEGFMFMLTTDGTFYRSSSVAPNTRDESSFLVIDKVIENKGTMTSDTYPFIVEGRFKVDLFIGMYGTTTEQVEGKFRWPVALVRTSELLENCQ